MVVLGPGKGRGKGGTTVKPPTKVAAPKPINLPSLRSEGLLGFDPAVPIIPAGSTGWGSKPAEESPREQAAPPAQVAEPEAAPPKKEPEPTSSSGSAWARPTTPEKEEKRPPPPQLAKEEFPSLGSVGSSSKTSTGDFNLRPPSMFCLHSVERSALPHN